MFLVERGREKSAREPFRRDDRSLLEITAGKPDAR